MDALYTILAVDKNRSDGKIRFYAVVERCAVVLSVVAAGGAALIIAAIGGDYPVAYGIDLAYLSIFIVVVQSIQLPLYFRFGYSKARRYAGVAPLAAVMVGFIAFNGIAGGTAAFNEETLSM